MYTQDIIIILDACRFDYFEKAKNPFEGELKKVNTGVSTTYQWYKKYWHEKTEYNLVTENPHPYHTNTDQAHTHHCKTLTPCCILPPKARKISTLVLLTNTFNLCYYVHITKQTKKDR